MTASDETSRPERQVIYETTLAKVAAKWTPPLGLGEMRETFALRRKKIAALDFSPTGVQAMLEQIDALLMGEVNLSRCRTLTDARTGLQGAFEDGRPLTHLWAIFDVFGFWPAADEVLARRVPVPPVSREESLRRLAAMAAKQQELTALRLTKNRPACFQTPPSLN